MQNRKVFQFILFIIICLFPVQLFGQKPSVNVYRLKYKNISEKYANNINEAIYSFVKEVDGYKIKDYRTFSVPNDLSELKSDFIFYGNITGSEESVEIELILKSVENQSVKTISRKYQNENLILIDSYSLVYTLFNADYTEDEAPPKQETVVEPKKTGVIGKWAGESGIRSITILPNMKGIILFDSDLSISVEVKKKGNKITIMQKGLPSPRQFPDMSTAIFEEVVKVVQPITWVLTLSDDESRLSGVRTFTEIEHTEKRVTNIKTGEERVVWKKIK